jgi:hypothetical protein
LLLHEQQQGALRVRQQPGQQPAHSEQQQTVAAAAPAVPSAACGA